MPEKMEKQSFKIFVGNVSKKAKDSEIRELFQKYGPVLETNIIRDYAFVHMENEEQAREAIKNLDGEVLHDVRIKCQPAVSRKTTESTHSVKLFLGNLSEKMKSDEIRDLFKDYGKVIELDIIRTYGFIHIEPNCDVNKIVRDLNLKEVDGQAIKVQVSTSRVRQKPGMGNSEQCYRCGRVGHWSRECPKLADVDRSRFSRGYSSSSASASSSTAAAAALLAADPVPRSSSSVYERDHRYSHLRSSGSSRYDDYDRYYDRLQPFDVPPSRSLGGHYPHHHHHNHHHHHHDPYDMYRSRSSAAAAAAADPYKMRSALDYDPLMSSRPRGVSDYALYDTFAPIANPRQSTHSLYGSHASSSGYGRRYAPY